MLKTNEVVLAELGVPEKNYNYDGHGGPSELRFFELSGDGDLLVLKSIAYELAVDLRKKLGEPYRVLPEPLCEKNGERAYDYCVLVKSSEEVVDVAYEWPGYGAKPGKWCLLLAVNGCLFLTDDSGDILKRDDAAPAFGYIGDDSCPIPIPAYDRYDWLTEAGHELKARLEAAGWTTRLAVSNGEYGDVEFGY